MKNSKKKIILSALMLAIGTSLIGSVTSTIAWYQYSTKANVAYLGSSAGASGNLQLRIKKTGEPNPWTSQLSKESIQAYLQGAGYDLSSLQPVTTELDEDRNAGLNYDGSNPVFYSNPNLGRGPYSKWNKAKKGNYISFPLELRYVARDGVKNESGIDDLNVAKPVYLSKLLIQEDAANAEDRKDLSEAVRVHISTIEHEAAATKKDFLISKNGGETVTNGNLDLNADGQLDKAYPDDDPFGFETLEPTLVSYGSGKHVSYAAKQDGSNYDVDGIAPILVTRNEDTLKLTDLTFGEPPISKSIGSTVASETEYLNVVVTIWVEGWHKFNSGGGASSIWSADYINSKFNVGIQFAVDVD
ncbi:MAG TPA: hypothetical protein GX010_04910 [Erysipelotrichaceae bacterium]|nr:hypothetical protein [Erysipelotrichaceae bacterium]